jgi:hypothetical protein
LREVGVGPGRLRDLLAELDARLGSRARPKAHEGEPKVEDLLAVDEEYRLRAGEEGLPTVASRSFNPEGESWLGLLHRERDGWKMRALFSNTAVAHRLGQTRDWVVVYFDKGTSSGQRTVVTETRGDLKGRRVVRGREAECRAHYHGPLQRVGSEPAA